ncbi:MAG TPA: type II secretion system protein [Smithellaceae bacterium]|nr:type II secretion system protein [Smithellaceae bacterium]
MKRATIASRNPSAGFTLLEVIVTLIVASLLGTLLVSVTGTAVTQSARLPQRLVSVYGLNQVMDNITADYYSMLSQTNDILPVLKSRIDNHSGNYGNYTATTSWIRYAADGNGNPIETGSNASDKILKVVITPENGDTGLSHTVLFTR